MPAAERCDPHSHAENRTAHTVIAVFQLSFVKLLDVSLKP